MRITFRMTLLEKSLWELQRDCLLMPWGFIKERVTHQSAMKQANQTNLRKHLIVNILWFNGISTSHFHLIVELLYGGVLLSIRYLAERQALVALCPFTGRATLRMDFADRGDFSTTDPGTNKAMVFVISNLMSL
ncbi:Uncharacterized protein Adt_40841 [Abeliophyllum distichum]|uniref:Uncharacterized protein n=1 Tax=Abeliophyllum distichum TaxID=126358 RepID=A0ABD1PM53_9LAMI